MSSECKSHLIKKNIGVGETDMKASSKMDYVHLVYVGGQRSWSKEWWIALWTAKIAYSYADAHKMPKPRGQKEYWNRNLQEGDGKEGQFWVGFRTLEIRWWSEILVQGMKDWNDKNGVLVMGKCRKKGGLEYHTSHLNIKKL